MLRIGICDDSQHDRDLIRETVGKALLIMKKSRLQFLHREIKLLSQ